jgi:putative ABC transport system permease protein
MALRLGLSGALQTNDCIRGVAGAAMSELLERARNIPGVQSAAFMAYLPLSGVDNCRAFDIEGGPEKPAGVYDITKYRPVSAGYFETIGIRIERGRGFEAEGIAHSPLVVAGNESMARKFWGAQDPMEQRVRFDNAEWRMVVGVVGDVHSEGLGDEPPPDVRSLQASPKRGGSTYDCPAHSD